MTIIELEDKIMHEFAATNSRPNNVLNPRWVDSLISELNPKQKGYINELINNLLEKEYVTIDTRMGKKCLVLTQLGYDYIFPDNTDEIIEKIQGRILKEFIRTNSQIGQIVTIKWIRFNLMEQLNPREKDSVNRTIDHMVNTGLVTFDQKVGGCLVLTKTGFDHIY